MEYCVAQANDPTAWTKPWHAPAWRNVESVRLSHFMGSRPEYFPIVEAKMIYDQQTLQVIFHVRDQFVIARARRDQEPVSNDSCVEFFFIPSEEIDAGYFNLEINCGGTVLFYSFRKPRRNGIPVSREHLDQIDRTHSLPKMIEREIYEPTEWTVSFRLPLDILNAYFDRPIQRPCAGATWRANFYKCADASSHPHWLTWSAVDNETPDFHRPADFGTLRFL